MTGDRVLGYGHTQQARQYPRRTAAGCRLPQIPAIDQHAALNRLSAVGLNRNPVVSYSYDRVGRLVGERFGNGVATSLSYDHDSRLTGIAATSPRRAVRSTIKRHLLRIFGHWSRDTWIPNGPIMRVNCRAM